MLTSGVRGGSPPPTGGRGRWKALGPWWSEDGLSSVRRGAQARHGAPLSEAGARAGRRRSLTSQGRSARRLSPGSCPDPGRQLLPRPHSPPAL